MTEFEESMERKIGRVLQLLRPKPCRFELIRLGGMCDGAYLLPNDLDGVKACFSPGVNNVKPFEDDLSINYGIACHMCDFSSDVLQFKTPLIAELQTFKKKWLDVDEGPDSVCLQEWISECADNHAEDLILQMDIEGAEYRNILHTPLSVITRFRIIVVEFHNLYALTRPDQFDELLGPTILKLHAAYDCVHAHPNNCGGTFHDERSGMNVPAVLELTYLRRDRNFGASSEMILPSLPHPKDISRNMLSKPPIHLNTAWLSGERSEVSESKIRADQLEFESWEKTQREKGKQ